MKTKRILRGKGVFVALLLLLLFFSVTSPHFFKLSNLINILRQISLLGIICMSMTMVITCGEIDLSVGAIYCLSAILAGTLMVHNVNVIFAVIVALLVGLLIGLANGILVTFCKIPAMIVTLGMMNIARGTALLTSEGRIINISSRNIKSPLLNSLLFFGQGRIFGIPVMTLCFIIVVIISWFIYHRSLLGFHYKAVGGNPLAAQASGINGRGIKTLSFGFNGLFSAFAGILNTAFLSNIQGTSGQGMEMNVIAAVIIGGTSLSGGEGSIIGTLIGVLIIGVLNNGIVLLGVSPFLQTLIIGIVIIGAVAIDTWSKRGRKE